jgi:hypothetical protein
MKTSVLMKNGASEHFVALIARLVKMIPWENRRGAMGDVALTLLEGRHRTAEEVFGWNRDTVELGIHEFQSGFRCENDLSNRRRPKAEDKDPRLLADIHEIMDPESQAEPRLRTTLRYTNMTARAVREALLEKGWREEDLPCLRTVSDILNRHGYRLRTVAKTKVQKKRT